MRANLRLLRLHGNDDERVEPSREVRFRYPADEEAWEVSCDPDRCGDETPERGLVIDFPARARRVS